MTGLWFLQINSYNNVLQDLYLLPFILFYQLLARLLDWSTKSNRTMIILDPSDNQNQPSSPLKKDDEISTAAPAIIAPPAYVTTQPPNPTTIPSYQAIPHSHHHHHHHPTLHRRSPLRRLLVAFAIAGLILLLWGVFVDSLDKVLRRHFPSKSRHSYESYKLVRFCNFQCFHNSWNWFDFLVCPQTPQKEIDNSSRILSIQYPPFPSH